MKVAGQKLPGRIARKCLDFKIRMSARRQAASKAAFKTGATPTYQRLLGVTLTGSWLEALGARAAAGFAAMNRDLQTLKREREQLTERLEAAKANAQHVPKIKLDVTTQLAMVLAQLMGLITVWPFIQTLEWPFPIAAVLAFALAAFEVAISGLAGLCVHALVMDDDDTPFELTVKQHGLFLACGLLCGAVAITSVIVLAALRGHGNHQFLWILLGLGLVAFGAYGGAAINDNKFDQEVKRLEKRLKKIHDAIFALKNAYKATERATMANGRKLSSYVAQIAQRAAEAFEKVYRKHHRKAGSVVPDLPQLKLPSDEELRRQLIVPMFDVDGDEVLVGDIMDDGPDPDPGTGDRAPEPEPVSPIRPQEGRGARTRAALTAERRSS